MGRHGEDQAPPRDHPLSHLDQDLRVVGDVLEYIECGDDVVLRVWVKVGYVPVGHRQPGASACHIRRLQAHLEPLNLAVVGCQRLQDTKHVAAAASNLEDSKAVREISYHPTREGGDGLVARAE